MVEVMQNVIVPCAFKERCNLEIKIGVNDQGSDEIPQGFWEWSSLGKINCVVWGCVVGWFGQVMFRKRVHILLGPPNVFIVLII